MYSLLDCRARHGEPLDLGLAGRRLDVVEADPGRHELGVAVGEVPGGLTAVGDVVVRQHLHTGC